MLRPLRSDDHIGVTRAARTWLGSRTQSCTEGDPMFIGITRRAMGAAVLASVVALAVAASASAGKGTTSTSTISLASPTAAATAASWPKYGDSVRFNVSTTAT